MAENKISVGQKIWFILLPILAIAFHFFSYNLLLSMVYDLFLNVLKVPTGQFMKFSYLAEVLVCVILILIFFIVYKVAFKKAPERVKTPLNLKGSAISLAAGTGVSGFSFLWVLLAEKIPALSSSLAAMDAMTNDVGGGSSLGTILLAVIAAPLLEELIFRGIVFRSIRKLIPGWGPIIVSAVFFGAYHMNIIQAVYATFMGIIAAIIYEKTDNLIYPILVHVANNLLGAVQSFIPSGTVAFAINIVSLLMLIPTCYFTYLLMKRNIKRAANYKDPIDINN